MATLCQHDHPGRRPHQTLRGRPRPGWPHRGHARGTIGLLGPNGAGKTTFLRLLLGLLRPTAGRPTVLGLDCQSLPLSIRKRIGYMPEHECHIPDMTGIGLVAYMARVSDLDPNTALGRAHDMLDFVGVGEERYRRLEEYSTGMKQRVKLAQSLAHDPDLFLFDEPTGGSTWRGGRRC